MLVIYIFPLIEVQVIGMMMIMIIKVKWIRIVQHEWCGNEVAYNLFVDSVDELVGCPAEGP